MFSLTQNYLTRGFWGDEAWTSLISQLPYLDMLKTTAADFHPPAYYSVVELVYKFLPPTEIVTRSISIIFYFLTLFLVYKLASEIKGPNSAQASMGKKLFGAISTLVVAVNPIFFTYAFEARNYTMFAFAATSSIYFLVKLSSVLNSRLSDSSQTVAQLTGQEKTDNWKIWALLFVFFSTLGIYTHYYMFFTLFAQGLYLLLFDRKIFWRVFLLFVIVGVFYLPWIPFLATQLKSVGQSYWIGGIDGRTHYEAFLRILGGEHKNIFRPFLFGFSIFLLVLGLLQHALRHKFEKPYLLIWLWATIPFILASLPGLRLGELSFPFRPIFFWRYLINTSVPLAMVMVHTSQKFSKTLFYATITILLILSVAVDILTLRRFPYTFHQVYQDKILPEIKPSDKIVTVLPSFAEVLYYRNRFGLRNELIVLPEGQVQFSGKSLLDAYVQNKTVKINDEISGRYFELGPGQNLEIKNAQ